MKRCAWVGDDGLMIKYHDTEWGKPEKRDRKIFEFIILEAFQAGLSWKTILNKRKNFAEAYDDFDYKKIAKYLEPKQKKLLQNQGIIRNRLKIDAAIKNAQSFMRVQKEFGSFSKYIWDFVDGEPIDSKLKTHKQMKSKTSLSEKISLDMKKRGFKFCGPTIIYALIQAIGMINDHTVDCFRYKELK